MTIIVEYDMNNNFQSRILGGWQNYPWKDRIRRIITDGCNEPSDAVWDVIINKRSTQISSCGNLKKEHLSKILDIFMCVQREKINLVI